MKSAGRLLIGILMLTGLEAATLVGSHTYAARPATSHANLQLYHDGWSLSTGNPSAPLRQARAFCFAFKARAR